MKESTISKLKILQRLKSVAKLIVNGKELAGTTVVPYEKGQTHYDVTVVMG